MAQRPAVRPPEGFYQANVRATKPLDIYYL